MDREKRVRSARRQLSLESHRRWKAFQLDKASLENADRNPDGSVPRPRIAAVTPTQRARFEERQALRRTFASTAYRELRVAAERRIGATLDFVDLPPDEQALKAGRPVVRLVTLAGPGLIAEGFATGFLVAPDLLITNHHVFRTSDEAKGVGAQFLYERTPSGLREGVTFELDPDRFFVNDRRLDYAVVAVKPTALDGAPLSDFRYLPLIAATGKIRKGDPVNIIQHPEGHPKQYATVNNRLLDLRDDGFLLYETDTLEGSSGSPLFNGYWEAIGLHHCGVPRIENGRLVTRGGGNVPLDAEVADGDLIWIANEGVRVSALVASLAEQRPGGAEQQRLLEALIRTTTDPLRLVEQLSPAAGVAAIADAGAGVLPGEPMAQTLLSFSGPVTILVSPAAAPLVAGPAPVAALLGVGAAPAARPREEGEPAGFREKRLKFDEDYAGRDQLGFDSGFLDGWQLEPPSVNEDHHGALLRGQDGEPWRIPYHHYSLAMNQDRRLLAWAASNVDYGAPARAHTKSRRQYGGENWRLDPRVALAAPGLQIEDADFYGPATRIDRGHIVRREDAAWGTTAQEAEFGNSDTYHWTNCTPQSEGFNQSGKDGIWGRFEDHIEREVGAVGHRMSVFAGPVLNPDDPARGYGDGAEIQVPMEFWKVIACVAEEGGEKVKLAYGFVFDQTDAVQRLGYERMGMDDYVVYQMPIAEITRKTGVVFDPGVLQADVLRERGAEERVRGFRGKRITSLGSVVLR